MEGKGFFICIWGLWISFLGKEGLPGILRLVLYAERNYLALDSIYTWDLTLQWDCLVTKPLQNIFGKVFLRCKLCICFQVGWLLAHSSAGFVKTSQHLVLLFLAVLSHSLIWVRIKMFVTVNFASLCLTSKWKNLQCQFAQKRVFRRIFILNTFICNAYILLSLLLVVSLITPWQSELWQDQTQKKHDQRKTEVLLGLNRFFNLRGDSSEKATWHPSVC